MLFLFSSVLFCPWYFLNLLNLWFSIAVLVSSISYFNCCFNHFYPLNPLQCHYYCSITMFGKCEPRKRFNFWGREHSFVPCGCSRKCLKSILIIYQYTRYILFQTVRPAGGPSVHQPANLNWKQGHIYREEDPYWFLGHYV